AGPGRDMRAARVVASGPVIRAPDAGPAVRAEALHPAGGAGKHRAREPGSRDTVTPGRELDERRHGQIHGAAPEAAALEAVVRRNLGLHDRSDGTVLRAEPPSALP